MGRMGQSWGIQSGMLQACGCWLAPWRRYTERKPRTTLRQGTDVGYNRVITPTPFAINVHVHVLYEKDCWCRRGEGEGYHAMHSVYSANILSCIIVSYSYYLASTLNGPLGRLSQGVPLVPGLLLLESLTGGGESGMCTVALWTSLMT